MRSSSWKLAGALWATLAAGAVTSSAQADDLLGLAKLGPLPVLVGLDSDDPFFPTTIQLLTGVAASEQLVGIDLEVATGDIYGVGHHPRTGALQLYFIDDSSLTAVATPVGAPFTPTLAKGQPKPTAFGFDFNPTLVQRARLVADNDMNIVFNTSTGAVTPATNLFYATGAAPDTNPAADVNVKKNPNVVQIAYDNNDNDPTTGSQQRGIDTKLDVLVTVANNTGRLRTIGKLGVNATAVGGYDVSSTGNTQSFAVMTTAGRAAQRLFSINNTTGAATVVDIPAVGLFRFTALTVLNVPAPPAAP